MGRHIDIDVDALLNFFELTCEDCIPDHVGEGLARKYFDLYVSAELENEYKRGYADGVQAGYIQAENELSGTE